MDTIKITSKTKQELANDYECHPQTIKNRCERIGIFQKCALSPKQVKEYYAANGFPGEEVNKEDIDNMNTICQN